MIGEFFMAKARYGVLNRFMDQVLPKRGPHAPAETGCTLAPLAGRVIGLIYRRTHPRQDHCLRSKRVIHIPRRVESAGFLQIRGLPNWYFH
jgi:hypothetical protein